ncbi:MAG: 2-oxoglutarate ferredoxin oxidoreductase subunit alpha, partial [Rhodothermales bacterium]|nr:2-oxoglutarate ferredoxin oxidoreductase subunit alpha [Rhodothermales bacterium]
QDKTGNVSYDPDNHELMTRLRAEKVDRVAMLMPPTTIHGDPSGKVLVIGWGSTRGAIEAAVSEARAEGMEVGSVHLRYLNPLPPDLGEVMSHFDHVIVPEINDGQLVMVLRARYLLPLQSLTKMKGLPFKAGEILEAIRNAAT